MTEEVFIEKIRDLVHEFAHSNKDVDLSSYGETIQIDDTHAVDFEVSYVKYNLSTNEEYYE